MMVTSSPEEIAAWNAKVVSDRLDRIANRRRDHRMARAFADSGQHPKFPKARVHKQHKHPLRDEHGAYTLVGKRGYETFVAGVDYERGEQHTDTIYHQPRMWLGGISAQRGY